MRKTKRTHVKRGLVTREPEESEPCTGMVFGREIHTAGVTSVVLRTKGNRGCPKKFI